MAAQYPDIGVPTYNTTAATRRVKDDSVVGFTVPPPVWFRDIAIDDVYVALKSLNVLADQIGAIRKINGCDRGRICCQFIQLASLTARRCTGIQDTQALKRDSVALLHPVLIQARQKIPALSKQNEVLRA